MQKVISKIYLSLLEKGLGFLSNCINIIQNPKAIVKMLHLALDLRINLTLYVR